MTARPNTSPLEYRECAEFAEWLDARGYLFSHVHQETYTKSWKQKTRAKYMGVRPGVPDYIITLKCQKILFIEMKRERGGAVSPAQRIWIDRLNECGAAAAVARGAAEAIAIVLKNEAPDKARGGENGKT